MDIGAEPVDGIEAKRRAERGSPKSRDGSGAAQERRSHEPIDAIDQIGFDQTPRKRRAAFAQYARNAARTQRFERGAQIQRRRARALGGVFDVDYIRRRFEKLKPIAQAGRCEHDRARVPLDLIEDRALERNRRILARDRADVWLTARTGRPHRKLGIVDAHGARAHENGIIRRTQLAHQIARFLTR